MSPAESPGGGEPTCVETRGTAGDLSCPELAKRIHCRACPAYAEIAGAFFARPGAEKDFSLTPEGEAEAAPAAGTLFLSFRAGDTAWAFPVENIEKVVPAGEPKPLPEPLRAPHRLGLAAIDGEVVLVVRLDGGGGDGPPPEYGILAKAGETRLAVAADGLGGFVRAAEPGPKPEGAPPYVAGTLGDAWVPDMALLFAALSSSAPVLP
ncbi:MAG: chemotaxis protein CheW [Kiritimatiellae bacterium]|nr:chemotaxis protein CheW [Kiritimatiellia bacterium]